jgi:hypothetical protein
MQSLLNYIKDRIATHRSCTVFESRLAHIWPRDQDSAARRAAAIKAFAEANGLSVSIADPGIRVTFKKR